MSFVYSTPDVTSIDAVDSSYCLSHTCTSVVVYYMCKVPKVNGI